MSSSNAWFILIQVGFVGMLLALGVVAGWWNEQRHLRSLREREERYRDVFLSDLRKLPGVVAGPQPPMLVTAAVVLATDARTTFVSGFRKVFGGEMRSYGLLLQRGRREVIARLVQKAAAQGYNAIGNVRFESSDIAGVTQPGRRHAMVALLAYGTAYYCNTSVALRRTPREAAGATAIRQCDASGPLLQKAARVFARPTSDRP